MSLSATLGLALTAALWWAFFGTGDDDRAEETLTGAPPGRRPRLVLAAYFYAYIPMLLGIVATAAGLRNAIGHPGATLTAGPALALAGGVTLFLAGDVAFRRVLGIGTPWYRAARRGAGSRGLAACRHGRRGRGDRAAHGRGGGRARCGGTRRARYR